jgi:hypothetical protein
LLWCWSCGSVGGGLEGGELKLGLGLRTVAVRVRVFGVGVIVDVTCVAGCVNVDVAMTWRREKWLAHVVASFDG